MVTLVEFQSPAKFFVQLTDNRDTHLVTTLLNKAIQCSLYGLTPYKRTSWTDFSVQICTQLGLTVGQQYSITCVESFKGNQVFLKLPDGRDLGDCLIDATGASVNPKSKYCVWDSLHRYVHPGDSLFLKVEESSIEGVEDFYAQIGNQDLHKYLESFQVIESQLNTYAQENPIDPSNKLDIDDFVLAEYNGSWSRGKIYGMENNQAVVGFIDYGNLETKPVAELMPLPRQFLTFQL
ncbi:hypothetical protein EB796_012702 [Bugula neritina]|uniref:Tudor domain-containing protein n=1 Tax=Bugula neritina TaxID=10212 RepID=A0A7J7JTK0_BUGNE|nr:hypothetical protein EB796_012702 [Bugula neritina]